MWIPAALEIAHWLQIAQIAVGVLVIIPAWSALYVLWIHRSALKLNATATRHQVFLAMVAGMKREADDVEMLHLKDVFDLATYEGRYKDYPARIESYLLMRRKYLYLLFSFFAEQEFPIGEKDVADKWIKELGAYQEFHDVHARHKRYYPRFAAHVTRILEDTKPTGWMCE